jgi:hypothetical protein
MFRGCGRRFRFHPISENLTAKARQFTQPEIIVSKLVYAATANRSRHYDLFLVPATVEPVWGKVPI